MAKTVTVDLDNATIGDLVLFDGMKNGEYDTKDLIAFLDKIVVSDTPVSDMPLSSMQTIMAAVRDELEISGSSSKN